MTSIDLKYPSATAEVFNEHRGVGGDPFTLLDDLDTLVVLLLYNVRVCYFIVLAGLFTQYPADQGTGTYGNYPLYIGRRGGTTMPFNGRIYQLIVRGAASNAGQIAAGEAWCNGKTRAY